MLKPKSGVHTIILNIDLFTIKIVILNLLPFESAMNACKHIHISHTQSTNDRGKNQLTSSLMIPFLLRVCIDGMSFSSFFCFWIVWYNFSAPFLAVNLNVLSHVIRPKANQSSKDMMCRIAIECRKNTPLAEIIQMHRYIQMPQLFENYNEQIEYEPNNNNINNK